MSRRWRWLVATGAGLAVTGSTLVGAAVVATDPQRTLPTASDRRIERPAPAAVTPTTASTAPAVVAPPAPAPVPVPRRWLILGDSVAESFAGALQLEASRHGVTVNSRTRPGCGMISAIPVNPDGSQIPWGASCARGTAAYQQGAMARYGAEVVIWHSSWEGADLLVNGQMLTIGTPAGDAALISEIEASIARMTAYGARVVLLTNVPRTPFNAIALPVSEDLLRRVSRLNQILAQVAEAHDDSVELVDLAGIACPSGPPCPADVEGVRLRPRDGSHFEGAGPSWLAPRLYMEILAALTHGPTSSVEFT